jgi:polysaccharide pyruvyl transferase WcaK-like protein
MRIIVDPGTFDCLNIGDVAMLQAAVGQLRRQWPDAAIQVFTNDPEAIARHCPGVLPLAHCGRIIWLSDRDFLGRLHQYLPEIASRALVHLKRDIRRRSPGLLEAAMFAKMRLMRTDDKSLRAFIAALDEVDLYVVSGAATMNDKAKTHARVVLATIEIAVNHGVPVAMFSQGFGPMNDPELFAEARRLLSRVTLIAVRENLFGPALLKLLGVSPQRVFVTGDDAIEMAYQERASANGKGIGVNIRVARSADIDPSLVEVLRRVLHKAANKYEASLIALPIALHAAADDFKIIRQLIGGGEEQSDGGYWSDRPRHVIAACGQCRIVVTGGYHAAVFALAQGIPAVCLFGNTNYHEKFMGLADQFGTGCELLSVNVSDFADRLGDAIERAWTRSAAQRMPLLAAAARQIELSDAAYGRFAQLTTALPSPLGAAA